MINVKTVYYQLTKEAAIPNWSDTQEAIGRWYKSQVYVDRDGVTRDYSYPYALQSDGTWMMCGRVALDFSKVKLYDQLPKRRSS